MQLVPQLREHRSARWPQQLPCTRWQWLLPWNLLRLLLWSWRLRRTQRRRFLPLLLLRTPPLLVPSRAWMTGRRCCPRRAARSGVAASCAAAAANESRGEVQGLAPWAQASQLRHEGCGLVDGSMADQEDARAVGAKRGRAEGEEEAHEVAVEEQQLGKRGRTDGEQPEPHADGDGQAVAPLLALPPGRLVAVEVPGSCDGAGWPAFSGRANGLARRRSFTALLAVFVQDADDASARMGNLAYVRWLVLVRRPAERVFAGAQERGRR